MAEGRTAVGRGVLLVFCAVFAVLFTAVGYWAGLRPLASTLQAALSVQSWQPVPAQVLDAQIRKHAGSEGGTAYQVLVRYRYEIAGKSYESQRVGLDPQAGADNVGDWQERWFQTLHQAQQQGRPITVWVNPAQPSEALVDPSIRWRLQIFRLPFALVFTGGGLGRCLDVVAAAVGPRCKGARRLTAQPADQQPLGSVGLHAVLVRYFFSHGGAVLERRSRTLVGQGASGCFCSHWRGHGLGCCTSNPQGVALPWAGHDGTAVTAQGWAAR